MRDNTTIVIILKISGITKSEKKKRVQFSDK